MSAKELLKDLALWLMRRFFFIFAFLTNTSSITCSVLSAVQLIPIMSAERTVEFQSDPRREINANGWVSAAVNLEHFVSSLSHSNQGWERSGSSKRSSTKNPEDLAFLGTNDFLRDIIKI